MLLWALPMGVLLTRAATAASRPNRNRLSFLSSFGGSGKASFPLPVKDSKCALLCDTISRRDESVSLSCQLVAGQASAGTLTFLSQLEPGQAAAAAAAAAAGATTVNNNLSCCKCDSTVGKIALQSWQRQNFYTSKTTVMQGPHACFHLPAPSSLWLVCSASTVASLQELPAQPRLDHCDEKAAPELPPLRSSEDIKQWIDSVVKGRKVVVFAKTTCSYCAEALETLQSVTSQVCAVMIDESPLMVDIQETLGEITGARTVPRVFIGGKFVGGCSDIQDLAESKALQKLIKETEAA